MLFRSGDGNLDGLGPSVAILSPPARDRGQSLHVRVRQMNSPCWPPPGPGRCDARPISGRRRQRASASTLLISAFIYADYLQSATDRRRAFGDLPGGSITVCHAAAAEGSRRRCLQRKGRRIRQRSDARVAGLAHYIRLGRKPQASLENSCLPVRRSNRPSLIRRPHLEDVTKKRIDRL